MSQGLKFGLGVLSKVGFWLARLREHLWLKPYREQAMYEICAPFVRYLQDQVPDARRYST
jgi:hypothetical protein